MSQDSSAFRFPTRPVRVLAEDPPPLAVQEGEEEGGDGDGHGTLDLAPPWHEDEGFEAMKAWVYERQHRSLFHRGRGKKIALRDLDTSQKIVRLIAALEHHPDMEVDALMEALNAASMDCYRETLLSVLSAHAGGLTLEWDAQKAPAPETSTRPMGHGF